MTSAQHNPHAVSSDDETSSAAPAIAHDSPQRFINRELSWLAFNMRVLEEADNPNHPLLERLRFLSISGSNLDEFYMVRVAGLRGQVTAEVEALSDDGLTPAMQLYQVNRKAEELIAAQEATWSKLTRELRDNGIVVLERDEADAEDLAWLEQYFLD